MLKILFFKLTLCLLVYGEAYCQKSSLSQRERQLENKFWRLCKYVKRTPFEDLSEEKLFGSYLAYYFSPTDTLQAVDTLRREYDWQILEAFDAILDTVNLKEYTAVPWNSYVHTDHLPKMIWEAKPLTHIFGKALERKPQSQAQRVAKGKKELESTLVIYRKSDPQTPRHFILFNEEKKIISLVLIRQGGLHYFLTF
ncbi:hypothetical protein Q0590_26290 [Rhodocytophaga aerolata]|uniref:Uncharacterized protein n=1 Tax=Rhodocytophaga aerolata TaxID=455078 RepID=A0ABT8RDN2_9BACT|nr:hypothetical protein [Rhodocytophaga aerolata]MDO1449816.1 hypothetical protein [Rhodocytophaga aerolata]